jgi:hypothetical protein
MMTAASATMASRKGSPLRVQNPHVFSPGIAYRTSYVKRVSSSGGFSF